LADRVFDGHDSGVGSEFRHEGGEGFVAEE
jgi:hypothetical protein